MKRSPERVRRFHTRGVVLLGGLVLVASLPFSASAGTVQPCVTQSTHGSAYAITMLPIKGGGQIYCQSAFGWSDTWFPTNQPTLYAEDQDALSGDNAPGLIYKNAAGAFVSSGNPYSLIAPWLDGTTLDAQFLGTDWTIINDITVNGNVGTSKITLGGLDVDITTTVLADGITESFRFTNHTGAAIQDLLFFDYYHFHPNGSAPPGPDCATTSFDAATGTAIATGSNTPPCSAIVPNGTMSGSKPPLTWDLDSVAGVLAAMEAANGGDFSGFNKATAPVVDGAVAVVWDLGPLGVGQSVDFTINKNTSVPEPRTVLLLGIGIVALALYRCRKELKAAA